MKLSLPFARVLSLSSFTLALALSGCPTSSEGDGDEDEGEGSEGEGEGEALTCEPRAIDCEDKVFTALTMNLDEAAPGLIENTATDDGFAVSVDATAGGFGGDGAWVYGKFTDDGLQKVELLDIDSLGSMDWDIAFRRFVIRLNSGYAGPSCVTAARTAVDTDYATLDSVPEGLTFADEQFMTDPDSCVLIPDGSGLESPGVVLQNWWEYPGTCVAITGNVYVVQLANGRHVKLAVDQYYASGQDTCNDTGNGGTGAGAIEARFAFLD